MKYPRLWAIWFLCLAAALILGTVLRYGVDQIDLGVRIIWGAGGLVWGTLIGARLGRKR